MSNNGEQWRKFVQTFFLAEQPNGYFVLNDIFRFLKEETVEGDDSSEPTEPVEAEPEALASSASAAVAAEPTVTVSAPDPVYEQAREATPAPVAEPVQPASPVEEPDRSIEFVPEPTQTPIPEAQPIIALVPVAEPNGHATEEVAVAIESHIVPEPAPRATPSPVPPASVPAPATQPQQSATATQQSVVPPQPRSWASLAATNQKKWGPVAQHEKGMSESVISQAASGGGTQVPAVPQATTPAGGSGHHGRQVQRNEQLHAAQSITTAHCFVKVRKSCSVLVYTKLMLFPP